MISTPTPSLFNFTLFCLILKLNYFNIARGGIVDKSALTQALQAGWIAGAALDTVFTKPLPPESPLWTLPNVFITPHCSGNSPRVKERTIALFLDNFDRYCHGKSLRNVVDKTA
ncbi:MAG: NAD(P)-dependent oxidoreductase, partial [Cuspidothrix sp.]